MIQFSLKCSEGHRFDSWFKSSEAFEALRGKGLVSCPACGGNQVEKAVMTPRVSTGAAETPPAGPLSTPSSPEEQALSTLRREIEENSEYVGMNFAAEARAIHEGTSRSRAIYGEARIEDARKLLEDEVPVTPLPFRIGRKSN